MSRPKPLHLSLVLIGALAVFGGLPLMKGGLYVAKHEGDMIHLLDIAFRMAGGAWPHLDFMTPIGALAFAPIALFVALGTGAGHAILYAQLLVGLVLLPAAVWVGVSRMRGAWAYLFGLLVVVLATALVHGEAERSVSISMHYNRWAWAISFIVLALALTPPPGRPRPVPDGVIVGLGMAALALIKVTFFAGFVLPVALALLLHRQWGALAVAALSGLAVVALVTVLAGPAFWGAYLGDLLAVAASDLRAAPGLPLTAVIGAPAYMGGSLVLILAVILWRQAGRAAEGLILLTLVPGFFYVTYQNYGNDPQWLMLLGLLLVLTPVEAGARSPWGWDLRLATLLAGTAALAMAAPSLLNMAYSPFRHGNAVPDSYAAFLPDRPGHADLQVPLIRGYRLNAVVPLDGADQAATTDAEKEPQAVLLGEVLPACTLQSGYNAWYAQVAEDLAAAGFAGARLFNADVLNPYWLFGEFRPLHGGAPWTYGGLPGIEAAEYLIVPLCPVVPRQRIAILETVAERGLTLTETRRTERYILLKIDRGDG